MSILKRYVPATLVLLSAGLTACKDSVGPEDVDAAAIQSSIQNMSASFDNAAFQSMAGLSFLFPVFPAAQASSASLPLLTARPDFASVSAISRRVTASRIRAALNSPNALFPSDVLCKTFEWSAATHEYVLGTLTGAPCNGVRFLLYTVSTVTGEPIVNQQLGYLELTDESSVALNALGVLITLGSTPVADYLLTSEHQTNADILQAEGFIRTASGSDQVDFTFNATDDLVTGVSTSLSDLAGSNGGFIYVNSETDGLASTITVGAGNGRNGIEMSLNGTDDPADPVTGTVKYNGTTVANISGTGEAPVFTAVSGRELRPSEVAALGAIFGEALILALSVAIAILAPAFIVGSF